MYYKRNNINLNNYIKEINNIIIQNPKQINKNIEFFETFNKESNKKICETLLFEENINNVNAKFTIINYINEEIINNIFNNILESKNITIKYNIINNIVLKILKEKYENEIFNLENIKEIVLKIRLKKENILNIRISIFN